MSGFIKSAYSHEEAIRMIKDGECGIFNPKLLKIFLNLADQLKDIYK
jgi:putative two-component system response regulator